MRKPHLTSETAARILTKFCKEHGCKITKSKNHDGTRDVYKAWFRDGMVDHTREDVLLFSDYRWLYIMEYDTYKRGEWYGGEPLKRGGILGTVMNFRYTEFTDESFLQKLEETYAMAVKAVK